MFTNLKYQYQSLVEKEWMLHTSGKDITKFRYYQSSKNKSLAEKIDEICKRTSNLEAPCAKCKNLLVSISNSSVLDSERIESIIEEYRKEEALISKAIKEKEIKIREKDVRDENNKNSNRPIHHNTQEDKKIDIHDTIARQKLDDVNNLEKLKQIKELESKTEELKNQMTIKSNESRDLLENISSKNKSENDRSRDENDSTSHTGSDTNKDHSGGLFKKVPTIKGVGPVKDTKNISPSPSHGSPDFGIELKPTLYISSSAIEEMKNRLIYLDKIKNEIAPVLMDEKLFSAMMVFRTRIGQLVPLEKKIVEVAKAINASIVSLKEESNVYYKAALHSLANVIIEQGEVEVSIRRGNAIPIAVLCAIIYKKHPEFLDILIALIFEKCPFILPQYNVMYSSMKEHNTKLKYRIKDGVCESQASYNERICGIFSIYISIVQTTNVTNIYGIHKGWQWIARTLNQKPTIIVPYLLLRFFEIAGHLFLRKYGRQAKKIISFIRNDYSKMFPQHSESIGYRLEEFFVNTIDKTGTILPLVQLR